MCLPLTLILSSRLRVTQVASNVGPVEVSGCAREAEESLGFHITWGAGSGGSWTPLPALCQAHGLPVPQVKRLETLLKFGLWLFGVPRANSKRCPRPVPVPSQPHQGHALL